MVKLVKFLPLAQSLAMLRGLHEPLLVRRLARPVGGLSILVLGNPDEACVKLRVVGHTVAFKFEVFELIVEQCSAFDSSQFVPLKSIAGWEKIKCLFRFEWLRPAAPEEVPPGFEEIVGDRGRREDIPATATNLTVSIVGLAFSSADQGHRPVAAILNSDDALGTLCILDNAIDIEPAIAECNIVDVMEAESWISELVEL